MKRWYRRIKDTLTQKYRVLKLHKQVHRCEKIKLFFQNVTYQSFEDYSGREAKTIILHSLSEIHFQSTRL